MAINDKIFQLRTEQNLSQKELAEKLGVSTGTIAEWESGETIPSITEVVNLCASLSVSADALLMSSDVSTSNNTQTTSLDSCDDEKQLDDSQHVAKAKKPFNKKLLIGIIAGAVALLAVLGFVIYRVSLPRIEAIKDFNRAATVLQDKNDDLDADILSAQQLIDKGDPVLDKSLIPALETVISETKASKIAVPATPTKVDDIIAATVTMDEVDYDDALKRLSSQRDLLEVNIQRYALVNAPSESYIIKCLNKVPGVVDISAVTEDNDPNGNLNKPGGYTAQVYFSHNLVNQNDVLGDTLIDKGTEAGGSIEVYRTEEEAIKRRDYLATFDGSILCNGSHTVVGTVLVRTSDKLTASQQKELEENIIVILTALPDKEPTVTTTSNTTKATKTTSKQHTVTKKTKATAAPNRNNEAVKVAEKWAEYFFPTHRALIRELLIEPSLEQDFDAFTDDEADYAIKHANINWKAHALERVNQAAEANPGVDFTPSDFINEELDGFTDEEAAYALKKCDINWKKSAINIIKELLIDSEIEGRKISVYDIIDHLTNLGFSDDDIHYATEHTDGYDKGIAEAPEDRVKTLYNLGYSREEIIEDFVSGGWSRKDAEQLVDEVGIE